MSRAFAMLLLVATALAQAVPARAADVSIEPPITFIQPGQTATVSVEVTGVGAAGLAGFQVEIAFDPAVFAAEDPNAAGPEVPFEPTPWLLTSTGRIAQGVIDIDNVAGRLLIAYGTEPGPNHPTADGQLAQIDFTAIGSGTSALTLDVAVLADGSVPPQALAGFVLDANLSAVAGITDGDGDQIPENVDGIGQPGDAPCTSGNAASCDDNCPILANTPQGDADGNGFGDACQDGWMISGVAAGGTLSLQVAGVDLQVVTTAGESAATVAANIAAAINADPTLDGLGINATANGGSVSANTAIANRMIADLGLTDAAQLPLTIGGLLAGALGVAGAAAARRRAAPSNVQRQA